MVQPERAVREIDMISARLVSGAQAGTIEEHPGYPYTPD
jgi:hypothetical protein